MHLDQYPLHKGSDGHIYEFESEGPKGKIKRMVKYHRLKGYPPHVFNLSFGVWNMTEGRLDDQIITNNNDRDKVLASVAATVIRFTADFPHAVIYAEGSTPARTRLYQMGIARFHDTLLQNFELEGFIWGQWEPFQKGVNYECFLLKRKISNFTLNQ